MRYQVPQFIETEVKLVGPFTLKQFLWIGAGGLIILLAFTVTQGFWFFLIAIIVGGTSLAFAFLKINDLPLILYIAYALSYMLGSKRYLYNRDAQGPEQQIIPPQNTS